MILFARTVLQENTPHTLDRTNASAAPLENTLQPRVPPVKLFARPVLQASTLVLVAMWLALTVLPESTHWKAQRSAPPAAPASILLPQLRRAQLPAATAPQASSLLRLRRRAPLRASTATPASTHWKEQRSAPTVPPDTPLQLELLSAPLFVLQALRHPVRSPNVLVAVQENTRLQDQARPVHNARMGIAVEKLQQLVSIAHRLQMHTFTNLQPVATTVTGDTSVYATWVTSAMYSVQVSITSH